MNLITPTVKAIWNTYVKVMKRYQQGHIPQPTFAHWAVLALIDEYWALLSMEIKSYASIAHQRIIRLNRFPDGRKVPGGVITRERTHALANRPDLRFNYKPYDSRANWPI